MARRTGLQLGWGKNSGAPLKKNFAPLKCLACPAKLPFPCSSFKMRALFLETNRKLFLFFGDQQRTRRKVDQPKNFSRRRNKFSSPKNNVLVVALPTEQMKPLSKQIKEVIKDHDVYGGSFSIRCPPILCKRADKQCGDDIFAVK